MSVSLKIDLHMHTSVSDGTDTPEEIVECVREAGIKIFSVTDHDAFKAACIIPDLVGGDMQFITGAEFSTRDEGGKYHVLGYGFDPESPSIIELTEMGHENRLKKIRSRLEFLSADFGFNFSEEDVKELLSLDNPGKPHIGKLMVKYGYAESINQAIKEYINSKRITTHYIEPQFAIEKIIAAGGVPVLAHPSYGDGDQLILGEEMEERLTQRAVFIGGASVRLSDSETAFFGDVTRHPDYAEMADFARGLGDVLVSLSDEELTDIGGGVEVVACGAEVKTLR